MTARTSFASTPCSVENLSMSSPYGTAAGGVATSATIGSGSGYGTSSGAKRAIVEASQMTSPPLRSVRTSELPSTRCALIDSVRPVAKYANSARAGATPSASTEDTKVTKDTKVARDTKAEGNIKLDHPLNKAAAVTPLAPFPPLCPLFTFVSLVRVRGGASASVNEGVEDAHPELPWILAVRPGDQCRHK